MIAQKGVGGIFLHHAKSIHDDEKFTIPIHNISAKISYQIDRYFIEIWVNGGTQIFS